MSDNVQGAA